MKYTKHFYTYFAYGDAVTLLWLPENQRNKQTTHTYTGHGDAVTLSWLRQIVDVIAEPCI